MTNSEKKRLQKTRRQRRQFEKVRNLVRHTGWKPIPNKQETVEKILKENPFYPFAKRKVK